MKHAITEQYLERGLFAWEYASSVELVEIDMKASEENPARLNRRLDNERAYQYAEDMEAGCEFPAIVLLTLLEPHDLCKYIVATGMHRLSATATAMRSTIDAYIVTEPDIYRREVLTRQLNSIEGRGMTIEEQITQVLYLKEQFPGKSLTELSKEWHIKFNTVQAHYYEQRSRRRARTFGYDLERAKIGQKSTIALGSIHSDIVFEQAIIFVCTTGGVQGSEIRDMVVEIKKARDEKSQLEIVRKYRENAETRIERAKAKHGRTKPAAINRVMAAIKGANNQLERPFEELHVAAYTDRVGALIVIDDTIENLKRLRAEFERCERMSPRPGPNPRPEMRI